MKYANLIRLVTIGVSLAVAGASAPAASAFASEPRGALAHHAVSTRQATAQSEFDQGLTLIYAFNPEEATFHFQQAVRADPNLAMAYWGIALAAGPNVNTSYDPQRASVGREAIAAARAPNGHANDEERQYIDALAKRYAAATSAQIPAAQTAYANAMGDLSRRFPADLDAKTLYAESLMDLTPLNMWHRGGSPNTYTRQVIALLEDVLRHDPNQLGANHYLIHAYEDSATPQAALHAAQHLANLPLPPGAEHLAHMPAHIFMRTGDYDAAIRASLRAGAMFETYLGQEHSDVHNGYYHHDLQVLDYAYMMSGQWSKAREVAGQIARQVDDNGAAVETYLRFHRWKEALALPAPAQPGLRWRWAQGMAQVGIHDLNGAGATLAWLSSLHDNDPRTGIARNLLSASVDETAHRDDRAISELRDAVALEDGLTSKEPPPWFYPIRESLGARLALAGRYGEAQRVFEEDLRRNPGNPRSLFGLARVLAKTQPAKAAAADASFRRAWSHADEPLTLESL
jgi:tetratricopeptide (TPR) repeat protein